MALSEKPKDSTQVSTIVEFRTVDFRMENCKLLITIPPKLDTVSNAVTRFAVKSESILHVWRVATRSPTRPINPKTLTWRTRPIRIAQIGTFTFIPGANFTHHFSCQSDSLHVFEFAAGNEGTKVEWSQDHSDPPLGAY